MSDLVFDIVNAVIAFIALVFSIASFVLYFKEHHSSKFNLKMELDKNNSFYFDALDTVNGNKESLIVSVTIMNNSSQPVNISDIQIILNKQCAASAANVSKYPYPETLPDETVAVFKDEKGFLGIKSVYGDGIRYIDLNNELIHCPVYLNAYDSVRGFLLFPHAGESKQKTIVRLLTSRGNLNLKLKITTKKQHESSFEC